ncbi:MAG: HlyD family efflux transporter periplasmic adaptor subunit [Phycisphaeraceae bacterium]|nr:HlyD family efflux transporter periplasmic adaptor subunit [Phycisphaeraceae bacterium]
MAERPTFSPFWHRVRAMRPRLRPHVQITRQHYRGSRWHVVRDPSGNQFYRLNPIAHEFVSLLDGSRTVEEVWSISLGRHGDEAPTQQEAINLLAQLYGANLLRVDATPEVEQLLRRGRERFKKKAASQAIGIMYFKIRVFNPDTLVSWVEPILRIAINRVGLLAWLLLVGLAIAQLVPHAGRLFSQFDNTLAPANWGWLALVFVVTKAWHELGHGVILKRFGGQVPEFGLMLLVLFPAPYVDASSAWTLENKWKRVAVGGGGMIFELFLAALAAIVWVQTLDAGDSLVHQLAYNAMLIASVSTILFNANPLMRFDGYYMLSDLLEMPNLMQRSMNLIKHLCKKRLYGLKDDTPPTVGRGERWILLLYGTLAIAYRIFLFFSITLYVMGKLFAIGLILAVWTAAMWFFLPIGKFVHWLAAGQGLHRKRPRAIATSAALIGAGAVLVGIVPMPDHRRAAGVIEPIDRAGVFFGVDGFIREAHVRPGARVSAGDPIITLENPDLVAQLASGRAEVARLENLSRQALVVRPDAAEPVLEQLAAVREQVEFLQDRLQRLVVRAPIDGVFVGPDPELRVGAFGREGEALGEVIDPQRVRVVATLSQRENDWAASGGSSYSVKVRMVSRAGESIPARVERVIPAGQQRLAHPSLGFAGGGTIQTEQSDQSGTLATSRQFEMELLAEPGEGAWPGLPGERVRLRFTLPDKPLAVQWVDALAKLVQGRVRL